MFGSIGGPEILLIFVLALLLFGPRKLPEIGKALGKTVAEFRKATQEFRTTLEREVEMERLKETGGALKSAGAETADAVSGPGLLGEIRAALRPPAESEPYGTGQPPAGPASPRPVPDSPPAGPPAGTAAVAPVPFSDDAEAPSRPAGAPIEHGDHREQP